MKIVRKWRSDLKSIEFPNHEKYTDNEILKIIYKDVPGRLALLNWIAVKISDDSSKFNMTKEDISRFFSDRGLLNKHLVKDFVQASCSEVLQEETWKILFSFTRMHKFLNPKTDYVGIQDKFSELIMSNYEESQSFLGREPSVTIEEIDSEIADSDLDRMVEAEVIEIKKEMERRANEITTESDSDFRKKLSENDLKEKFEQTLSPTMSNDVQQEIVNKKREECKPFMSLRNKVTTPSLSSYPKGDQGRYLKKKLKIPLFPVQYSIEDIKLFGDEPGRKNNTSGNNQSSKFETYKKKTSKEWFKDNEVIPRLYVMPGSPPLGNLDPNKIKIVAEDSAPPITLDGSPYHNHSQWDYRLYEVENPHRSSMSLEEFRVKDRSLNTPVFDEKEIK